MGSMDVSATMAAWQEFFVVIAGAAAVLLGLVFVGESIQAAGAAGVGHHWDLAFSSPPPGEKRASSRPQLLFRFALPLVAMIVLIAAGVGLALGWVPAVWLIAGAALAHIVTGTQNAWDLLLGVTVKTD